MPAVASGRSAQRSRSSPRLGGTRKSSFSTTSVASPMPALEDGALLEERDLHLTVPVAGGEVAGDPLEAGEGRALGGEEVAGAPGGAEGRHGAQV